MSSTADLKPIKHYGQVAPNPVKTLVFLIELNLPYEIVHVPFSDVRKPDYIAINPNGRLPAIHDPNTDLTLWESGAITEYLMEHYDKDHKLSFPQGSKEAYLAKQWLAFQISGQGPYYGQFVWFSKYHSEKLPSAIERYSNEVKRVTGVLEKQLEKQKEIYGATEGFDGPWILGNKMSFVDLAFVPWQGFMAKQLSGYDEAEFPLVTEWLNKMMARESVQKVLALQSQVQE
ncbi:hypothetical protein VTK26DRAFT_4333 [Humicola hyalothermophila]